MLVDSFGRAIDYLRVSITDRCNLRCLYCMPPEGVEWKPHQKILTFEEITRIVKIMADLGVTSVKITGGEPLLRRGTPSFLRMLKTVAGIKKVTLTTNGILLGAYLDETDTMGDDTLPDGVNISLDALDNERYKRITRVGDDLNASCNGVFRASCGEVSRASCNEVSRASYGEVSRAQPQMILPIIDRLLEKQINVKINCVPIHFVNDEEIIPIAALAKEKNIVIRFIELMPFGAASAFQPVTGAEAAARIEKAFGALTPFNGVTGSGPAVYYSLQGFTGKIGFINPVTRGFCETCNRLRITSEGFLKLCVSSGLGVDLREPLRSGVENSGLARIITDAVKKKPRSHSLSKIYGIQENHPEGLSKIGG